MRPLAISVLAYCTMRIDNLANQHCCSENPQAEAVYRFHRLYASLGEQLEKFIRVIELSSTGYN